MSTNDIKILIIKLSSLGDVLHNLPVVWDIRARYPHAQIDWVVEESLVGLLEPLCSNEFFRGIDRVIPIGLRRWKKALKSGRFIRSIQEFLFFKQVLRNVTYDLILDTQGLIKSAAITRFAKLSTNGHIVGPANKTRFSGFETLARRFYTEAVELPFHLHAVERARWIAAGAIDVPAPRKFFDLPRFYPEFYLSELSNQVNPLLCELNIHGPYVVFFHSTSRVDKRWPESSWVAVGQHLAKKGYRVILPWGSATERKVSDDLSRLIPESVVPRSMTIPEIQILMVGAKQIIGVDTGLVHVSAAFCQPTIEIYCNSWKGNAEGYWSPHIHNLGDMGQTPSVEDVIACLR